MRLGPVAVAILAAILLASNPALTANPDALWHIVSDQCVKNQQQQQPPKPCEQVDLAEGYVVLKDIVGETQFLVMPTAKITGIESPEILAPESPKYWQDAWQARHFVNERAPRPLQRDDISLAINAMTGRTQNQLHIHVDCVRADVASALREHVNAIGSVWAQFPVPLAGHDYMAMRIDQPDLNHANPFLLLADGIAGARSDMAHYTLVVVGMPDGFVLLANHATGITNRGSGEELQDHNCALAH